MNTTPTEMTAEEVTTTTGTAMIAETEAEADMGAAEAVEAAAAEEAEAGAEHHCLKRPEIFNKAHFAFEIFRNLKVLVSLTCQVNRVPGFCKCAKGCNTVT